jgi:hypothetical protein
MMVRTWTDWNLIREPLRASSLKEGAVVAGGEEKHSHGKDGETDCR